MPSVPSIGGTTNRVDGSSTFESDVVSTAPNEAKYLIASALKTSDVSVKKVRYISDDVEQLKDDVLELKDFPYNDCKNADSLFYRGRIPERYFASPGGNTFDDDEYLLGRINTIPNGKHFIFVTDTHWDGNKNAHHTNNLIQYTRGIIGGSPDVIFGGDVINANSTKFDAVRTAKSYINESIEAYGNHFIPVFGNHDLNTASVGKNKNENGQYYSNAWDTYEEPEDAPGVIIPYRIIEPIFNRSISGRAVFRAEDTKINALYPGYDNSDIRANLKSYFRLNYTITDESKKIYYIVYNTGVGCPFSLQHLGATDAGEIFLHIDWLYKTLMNAPAGYDIVVSGHEPIFMDLNTYPYVATVSTSVSSVLCMLSCFKAKKTASVYVSPSTYEATRSKWVKQGVNTFDFSDAPSVGKVIVLSGHWHHDFTAIVSGTNSSIGMTCTNWDGVTEVDQTQGQIPVIGTMCDAFGQFTYADDVMVKDTVSEHAFDVLTFTDDGITTTRIGCAEYPNDHASDALSTKQRVIKLKTI